MNYYRIKFILDCVLLKKPRIVYNDGVLIFGCGNKCPQCHLKPMCENYFDDRVPHLEQEEAKYFIRMHPEFLI